MRLSSERSFKCALLAIAMLAGLTGSIGARAAGTRPPLIVMVHGWAGDRRVWIPVLHRLHLPAVAVDLPGHGKNRWDVSGWPISRFSEAIEQSRIRARHDCVVLVTHSNGSYVALDYWRHHRGNVGAMVIVEGTFTRPYRSPDSFEQQIAQVTGNWGAYSQKPFGLDHARNSTAELVRRIAASARPSTARATLEMLLDPAIWEQPAITVPVTYVLTQSPSWTEAERARLRAAAANAEFIELGPLSHYAQLDAPDDVARIIEQAAKRATCESH